MQFEKYIKVKMCKYIYDVRVVQGADDKLGQFLDQGI